MTHYISQKFNYHARIDSKCYITREAIIYLTRLSTLFYRPICQHIRINSSRKFIIEYDRHKIANPGQLRSTSPDINFKYLNLEQNPAYFKKFKYQVEQININ